MGRPAVTRLLLVEDDELYRSLLSRALSRHQFEVHAEASAEHLLASLARLAPFQRAILDLRLPGDSGLKLIQPVLAHSPDCQILMLTGFASIATAVEAIKLGASQYLTKPAELEQILHALTPSPPQPDLPVPSQPPSVERLEWEHIHKVLTEHQGNISATARALRMHRRTLQRKLAKKPSRF